MNRNYARTRNGFKYTLHQRRARELNWAIYIASGFVANLEHALSVNAYTMDRPALSLLNKVKKVNEQLLEEMKKESKKPGG